MPRRLPTCTVVADGKADNGIGVRPAASSSSSSTDSVNSATETITLTGLHLRWGQRLAIEGSPLRSGTRLVVTGTARSIGVLTHIVPRWLGPGAAYASHGRLHRHMFEQGRYRAADQSRGGPAGVPLRRNALAVKREAEEEWGG